MLLALAAPACDTGGGGASLPPFECWYRTTSYNWLIMVECESCEPDGAGGDIICSCSRSGFRCNRDMEPDFGNPEDGLHSTFASHWIYDICYRGPQPQIWPPPNPCYCYGAYLCWRECEGRWTEDGRMVCMVDGTERTCQPEPPMDETHRVVICRHGVAPVEWPLQEQE